MSDYSLGRFVADNNLPYDQVWDPDAEVDWTAFQRGWEDEVVEQEDRAYYEYDEPLD